MLFFFFCSPLSGKIQFLSLTNPSAQNNLQQIEFLQVHFHFKMAPSFFTRKKGTKAARRRIYEWPLGRGKQSMIKIMATTYTSATFNIRFFPFLVLPLQSWSWQTQIDITIPMLSYFHIHLYTHNIHISCDPTIHFVNQPFIWLGSIDQFSQWMVRKWPSLLFHHHLKMSSLASLTINHHSFAEAL